MSTTVKVEDQINEILNNEIIEDDLFSNNESEKEEVKVSEEQQEEVQNDVTSWFVDLDSISDTIEFSEFGEYKYLFKRVFTPSGEATNYFSVFCKDVKYGEEWETLNGLLSSRYSVLQLEKFVNSVITDQIIPGSGEINCIPFLISYKMKTPIELSIFEDEESKWIYSILTGTLMERINEIDTNTALGLVCTNSYSGKLGVKIDYTLENTINNKEFVEFFTLLRHSNNVKHLTTNSDIVKDIADIKTQINAEKERIKSKKEVDNVIQAIAKKIGKASISRRFLSLCEGLGELKNLYYVLLTLSIVFNEEPDLNSIISVRNYVYSLLISE